MARLIEQVVETTPDDEELDRVLDRDLLCNFYLPGDACRRAPCLLRVRGLLMQNVRGSE